MRAASKSFNFIFRCKQKIIVSAAAIPLSFEYNMIPIHRFVSRFAIKGSIKHNQLYTVSYCYIISKFISNHASANKEDEEILNRILATIENAPPESCMEICTAYIDKLCKTQNVSGAIRLLQSLRVKNMFLSKNTYNVLLVAAGETNDFDLLLQVFKDLLVSCRFLLSSTCYLNLAKGFANTKDCVQILRFVKEVSEIVYPSSSAVVVVNRIIFAFSECGQIEKALLIFEQMKGLKCEPDLITYNTVLDILGRTGRTDEMLGEFASMKEAGVNPDFISYNTLINNLRKVGRLDMCLVFLREMGERGIEPDLLTYTALIESFGRSGNIEESLRLFGEMKLRKIRPSVYIYRSIINNLKKMGKVELAMKFWEEMNSSLSDLAGPGDFKRKGR